MEVGSRCQASSKKWGQVIIFPGLSWGTAPGDFFRLWVGGLFTWCQNLYPTIYRKLMGDRG